MKGISKFLTAAVALTAFASCADDLDLSQQGNLQGADMVATLDTDDTFTRLAATDNKGVEGITSIVWSPGEKVRVFTLDQLSYDIYSLMSGAGTVNATFKQEVNNNLTGQKYAITEADMIYGVSATQDGSNPEPLLTLTLPREWTPGTTSDGNQMFPIPYWGPATVNSDNTISASLTSLTAFLRVNLKKLPTGTKYLVLTTHGCKNNPNKDEGFMLAPFEVGKGLSWNKDVDIANSTEKPWWYAQDANGDYTHAKLIKDGNSEPLTGTLNATLSPNAELKIDDRLVYSDEMIVNISNLNQTIAYVPIVCGEIENLHVIAASYVSQNLKYCYAGEELRVFQNENFKRNKAYYLDMSFVNLGTACIGEVNQAIYQTATNQSAASSEAGMTTLITVDSLYKDANVLHTGTNHNDSYIDVSSVKGNIILNIKAIGLNDTYGNAKSNPLLVTDKVTSSQAPVVFKGKNSTVQVIVPNGWDVDGDNRVADTDKNYLKVNLGKHDLILNTQEGIKAQNVYVDAFGSNTIFSTKTYTDFNSPTLEGPKTAIEEEKQASMIIYNGFANVNVLAPHAGDVYVYTPRQAEEETEIDSLDIQTLRGISIRQDDALVGAMKFSNGLLANDNRLVFTTGSSAIKNVYTYDGVAYETPATSANTPSRVIMRSFWGSNYPDYNGELRGHSLSARAIASGYDTKTIYTVAQLASVGEGIYADNASSHESAANVAPEVAEYNIPIALVQMMWLGADKYKWMGARARVEDFSIDGEFVELKNMNMEKDWFTGLTYVDDPHWCCTTCWKPASKDHGAAISSDFGLIRSVINTSTVTIKNINLNDVKLTPQNSFSNLGSVVGRIQNTGITKLIDNKVGEVKINTNGSFVGGIAGTIQTMDSLYVTDNEVAGTINKSGYIKGGSYVGGIFGNASQVKGTQIDHNVVQLAKNEEEANSGSITGVARVGGIAGSLSSHSKGVLFDKNHVYVTEQIKGSSSFAGGIAGYASANDVTTFNENIVNISNDRIGGSAYVGGIAGSQYSTSGVTTYSKNKVASPNIIATNNYAGGLAGSLVTTEDDVNIYDIDSDVAPVAKMVKVSNLLKAGAQYAGGLIGYSRLTTGKNLNIESAQVEAGTIEGTEGFVGGFVGMADQGITIIGTPNWATATYDRLNKIDVAKMAGRYAVGGVIGNNAQSQKSPVNIYTGQSDNFRAGSNPRHYFTTKLEIEVKEYAKVGTELQQNENYKYGTMSNIIGLMNDNLYINQDKSTNGATYELLKVTDHLDAAMKVAVGYKKHADNLHNESLDQFYWGDQNGYVGWRATGTYKIGAKESSLGEQLDPDRLPSHNCYYQDGYYTTTFSKWQ